MSRATHNASKGEDSYTSGKHSLSAISGSGENCSLVILVRRPSCNSRDTLPSASFVAVQKPSSRQLSEQMIRDELEKAWDVDIDTRWFKRIQSKSRGNRLGGMYSKLQEAAEHNMTEEDDPTTRDWKVAWYWFKRLRREQIEDYMKRQGGGKLFAPLSAIQLAAIDEWCRERYDEMFSVAK